MTLPESGGKAESPSNRRPATSVALSGWFNIGAKALGTGMAFLLQIALARSMSQEAYGDIALSLAWLAVATALTGASLPMVVVRFVAADLAEGRADLARGVVRFAVLATVAVSALVGGTVFLALASGMMALPRDLKACAEWGVWLLAPNSLLLVFGGVLQGLKRVVTAEILANLLRTLGTIAVLGWLWLRGETPLPAPMVLMAYLGATVLALLVCSTTVVFVRPFSVATARTHYIFGTWLRTAFGFTAVMIVAAVNERVDVLMMGFSASPAEVAVYSVAVRLAQTVIFAANAAAAVMAPHLAERIGDLKAGHRGEVQRLLRDTARTILGLTVIALLGFAVLAPFFIDWFGADYAKAYAPLLVLMAGQAVAAVFGPAATAAALIGKPGIAVFSLLGGMTVNIAGNVTLVPILGATGAALATASGGVTAALGAWVWTRRRLSIDSSVIAKTVT